MRCNNGNDTEIWVTEMSSYTVGDEAIIVSAR
jgi:hypothetical protein